MAQLYKLTPFREERIHQELFDAAQQVIDEMGEADIEDVVKPIYIYLIDADYELAQPITNNHVEASPIKLPGLLAGSNSEMDKLLLDEADHKGLFLFLSRSASLSIWKEDNTTQVPNHHHQYLKISEFFIRICKSYQIGEFVSCPN